jgi:hypothetical protein
MFKLGVLVVCLLNNFKDMPSKIDGTVVLKLENFITISIENEDKSQVVELTFNKNMCTEKKQKGDL